MRMARFDAGVARSDDDVRLGRRRRDRAVDAARVLSRRRARADRARRVGRRASSARSRSRRRVGAMLPEIPGYPGVRYLIAFALILIGALLLGALIAWPLAKVVRAAGLGFVDRFLGSIFGLVRGVAVDARVRARRRTDAAAARRLVAEFARSCRRSSRASLALKPWLPERLGASGSTTRLASARVAAAARCPSTVQAEADMCGILGAVAHTPVNQLLYDGLLLLQHRGQDAAGIVTSEGAGVPHVQGPGLRPRRVPHAQHARAAGHAGHRALPLSDGGLGVLRPRVAAVLRQLAVRRDARAQRQPDQQRSAEARAVPARLPPRQHQFRQRGAAERAGARARARRAASPARSRRDLPRRRRRASALSRRLRGRRDDRRLRHARVPRSVRHPAADHRRQRGDGRSRVPGRIGIGRARAARLLGAARRRARRSDLRRPGGRLPRAPMRRQPDAQSRASSSTSTSRGPIRSSTARRSTRRGCRWAAALARKIRDIPRGAGHRRRDPDSRLEPALGAASSRTRSARRTAKASSRTATSAARSSCPGRRCARRACGRS